MSIAKQIQEASEKAGRLVFPEGVKAVAQGYGDGNKSVAFSFSDGSELSIETVLFYRAYWSEPNQSEYKL